MQNIDGMPLDISPGLVLHGQFRVGLWLCQAVRHCASGFRHPRAHTEEVSQHFPDPGEGSRERGMLLAWDFSSGMPWWSPKTQVVWEWLGQLFSQTELSNFVLTGSNRCGSTKYFRGSVEMLHRSHWRTPGRLQNAAVIPKTSWATSALESSSLSDFFCAVLFTRHLRKMAGWCFFSRHPQGTIPSAQENKLKVPSRVLALSEFIPSLGRWWWMMGLGGWVNWCRLNTTSNIDFAKGQWLWGLWNHCSPCIRLTDKEVVPIPWTVQNWS